MSLLPSSDVCPRFGEAVKAEGQGRAEVFRQFRFRYLISDEISARAIIQAKVSCLLGLLKTHKDTRMRSQQFAIMTNNQTHVKCQMSRQTGPDGALVARCQMPRYQPHQPRISHTTQRDYHHWPQPPD